MTEDRDARIERHYNEDEADTEHTCPDGEPCPGHDEPSTERTPTCYVQFMGGAHCATPPVAGQPSEAQPDAVYPPRERWYVEYLFGPGSDPWWGVAQGPHTSREQALAEKESRRDEPAERRIVRETTTWTVEEDRRG